MGASSRGKKGPDAVFLEAHFFQPVEFQRLLRPFGPLEWGSAVFVGPSGECLRLGRVGGASRAPLV